MTTADHCPGALRPHRAEDGLMVRLRVPGGQTTGAVLAAVASTARRYGNPDLQLTTRAGLQIRGLSDPVPAAVVAEIAAAGLLPSVTHERVRNIVASPFTGVAGGRADLRPMIDELDRALMADPALAGLSGRFLFALDDGRRDVSRLPFDLGYQAESAEAGTILVGSAQRQIPVSRHVAVLRLIELARSFLAAAHGVWHVRDVPGWAEQVVEHRHDDPSTGSGHEHHDPSTNSGHEQTSSGHQPEQPPLGVVVGAASVLVPLGLLSAAQTAAVATVADGGPVVITPWRGLIVPGGAAGLPALVDAGLVADQRSGWALVSACVGAPHCVRTTLDTRAVAVGLVANGVEERVHVSGCERRCGAPTVPHRELVAS